MKSFIIIFLEQIHTHFTLESVNIVILLCYHQGFFLLKEWEEVSRGTLEYVDPMK